MLSSRISYAVIITGLLLILLAVLAVPSIHAEAGGDNEDFPSPDRKCMLRYEGAMDHGEGIFYRVQDGRSTEVLKTYLRYGPQVNWESGTLAEIFIPEGSPGYHSYYYDCVSGCLSPSYGQSIALNAKTGILVGIGDDELYFYKLFRDKPAYTALSTGVGLIDFFEGCESDAFFKTDDTLRVEMKCFDGRKIEKEFKIPSDNFKTLMNQ